VTELRGVSTAADGALRIGALTTVAEVAVHPIVTQKYVALANAAASVATPQIRNQGTIGGNLCQRPRCWYFRGDFDCARKGGDTCYAMGGENQQHAIFGAGGCLAVHPSDTATALVALGARVTVAGPRRPRTVPLESFFLLPERNLTKENALETGELAENVLHTHPQNVTGGFIEGVYSPITFAGNERFEAVIGCLAAQPSCTVTFEIQYLTLGEVTRSLARWTEIFDGEATEVQLDLSPLAGQTVPIILRVEANASPAQASAFWLRARILR